MTERIEESKLERIERMVGEIKLERIIIEKEETKLGPMERIRGESEL